VGNKTRITSPESYYYSRTYDALNRLHQIKDGDNNNIADYTYDDLNRRTRRDYLNGTWAAYTYNDIGWLTDLGNWATGTTVPISTFSYTHDNVGNRLTMTTSFGTQTYSYDNIYQVTGVDYPAFYAFSDMAYQYDSCWNRESTINGGTTNYLTNNLNQYSSVGGTSYTYDLNGNLTNDGSRTYYYDCEDRLTKVVRNSDAQTLGEYKYGPFFERIQKIVGGMTSNYIYDGWQVIEERNGNGDLLRHFAYGSEIDESLVMHQDDTYYYYHRDGLGSVVNLTDLIGTTAKSYYFDVYGDFSASGSLSGNPYTFTGRRYDSENGLFYYRARSYSPELGRFIQVDPKRFKEGPNLYTYVLNAPNMHLDPFGKSRGCQLAWANAMYEISSSSWKLDIVTVANQVDTDMAKYRDDPEIRYNPETNGWNAFHCLMNCHMAKICGIDRTELWKAMIINLRYEFCSSAEEIEKYGGNLELYILDVKSDMLANLRGQIGAQSDSSCYEVCRIETDPGRGPETPPGPNPIPIDLYTDWN